MRKASLLLAATGLLALAACNRHDDAPAENDVPALNVEDEQPVEAPPVLEPETPVNSVASNSAAAAPPPPPPPVSEDQQTLDDADASGLTSRLPDDYDSSGKPTGQGE